jgi:hypothetical protein
MAVARRASLQRAAVRGVACRWRAGGVQVACSRGRMRVARGRGRVCVARGRGRVCVARGRGRVCVPRRTELGPIPPRMAEPRNLASVRRKLPEIAPPPWHVIFECLQ